MSTFHSSSLNSLLLVVTVSLMVTTPATGSDADMAVSDSNKFYLRAGMALDWSQDARFMDRDCSSTAPAALYGCGTGSDGAPLRSVGDFGTMMGFELGVGRSVSQSMRVEGKFQYRPRFSFAGHANFTQEEYLRRVSADASSVSALLAAYVDLTSSGPPRLGRFSPFIGGGVGFSRIEIDETRMSHPEARTTTIVPGGRRTNLAGRLAAGVAMPLGEAATLDFEWRYTDSGTVETDRDKLRIVWRDGSREPFLLDLAETRASLASHGLHVSLRYAF